MTKSIFSVLGEIYAYLTHRKPADTDSFHFFTGQLLLSHNSR